MTTLLTVFGVWLVGGVALSVRSEVRRAGRRGRSRVLAVARGVLLVAPVDWAIVGLAALAVLVSRAL